MIAIEILAERARDALAANHGDERRAALAFARLIEHDANLRDALCYDFICRVEVTRRTAGHDPPETQHVDAGSPSSRKKKVDVRAHKRRTPDERSAARAAQLLAADAIFDTRRIDGRAIGDLAWRELRAIAHDHAMAAASYLRLGAKEAEDAVLVGKIMKFAVPTDDGQLVREVIKAAQLEMLAVEAREEAPKLLDLAMRKTTTTIETREIEHA